MLFKTHSAAVFGIDAYLVEVEVDVGPGQPGNFNVVGLPDIAVKESRERVKAALKNCGFDYPGHQAVTVNLAPADMRKEGSAFDLPMALGLLGCQGTFFGKVLERLCFSGRAFARWQRAFGARRAFGGAGGARTGHPATSSCRKQTRKEAAVVEGIRVFAVKSLPQGRGLDQFAGIVRAASAVDTQADAWRGQRNMPWICATCAASNRPSARWKWPAPAGTTFCSSARRAPEKRCSPSASPRFCRRCRSRKRSKPRAFTASRACSMIRAASSARGPTARRTTPSATPA